MINNKIIDLYPPIYDRTNDLSYSVNSLRPFFGDHHPLLYIVYDKGYNNGYTNDKHHSTHDKVFDFCQHIGMSDENTLIWILRFGEYLPKSIILDDNGVPRFENPRYY